MAGRARRPALAWVPESKDARLIQARVSEIEVEYWPGTGPLPESADRVEYVVSPLFASDEFWDALPRLPRLRYLQLLSSGYEHAVGRVPAHVAMLNGRGIHDVPVSEWVVAAILAHERGFPKFFADQREHRWDRSMTGTLNRKRVLLVGYGSIAHAVEERLVPFGVTIDRIAATARDRVHPVQDMPRLIARADVVVVLLPENAATRNLISRDMLALMKDAALIVNAGRGGVVEQNALILELAAGRLRAALDVFTEEPLSPEHPLWDSPGLLLTPHAASDATGKEDRIRDFIAAQLHRLEQGSIPVNLISPTKYQFERL